nr:DHH family phosphoesterase [Clostridiales bacterium]
MPGKFKESIKNKLQSSRFRLRVVCVAVAALYTAFCVYLGSREQNISIPAAYLAAAALFGAVVISVSGIILYDRFFRRSVAAAAPSAASNTALAGITTEFIVHLKQPVLICDDSGAIVWHNASLTQAMQSAGVDEDLRGMNLSHIIGVGLESMNRDDSDEGTITSVWNRFWQIKSYRFESRTRGKFLNILVWHDASELTSLRGRLTAENTVIACIALDNLDEISQFSRTASSESIVDASMDVRQLLLEWASGSDGIIREYGANKFIFLFTAEKLDGFVADKFSILDKIRTVRVGSDISLPVTVSVGIGSLEGSLADKEKSALSALETALQRGGDQVVLKTESGYEFYGGRTRGVMKRTKVRARVVAEELAGHISSSSNVIVMCHRWADFDAIGSCVGVARLAMYCGVKVNIVVNRSDPNLTGCLEMLSALPQYDQVLIDPAEAQDMIEADTLLVICDVNNPTQFEAPELARNSPRIAIIDHHRRTVSEDMPAKSIVMPYIEPTVSSACELVSEILELSLPSGTLAPQEAEILLAGILVDTKHLSRNVGVRTFSAALWLRSEGADLGEVQNLFKTDMADFASEAD